METGKLHNHELYIHLETETETETEDDLERNDGTHELMAKMDESQELFFQERSIKWQK